MIIVEGWLQILQGVIMSLFSSHAHKVHNLRNTKLQDRTVLHLCSCIIRAQNNKPEGSISSYQWCQTKICISWNMFPRYLVVAHLNKLLPRLKRQLGNCCQHIRGHEDHHVLNSKVHIIEDRVLFTPKHFVRQDVLCCHEGEATHACTKETTHHSWN